MAHKIHLYTHSFNFFSYCLFAPIPASMYPPYAVAFFRTLAPSMTLSLVCSGKHARARSLARFFRSVILLRATLFALSHLIRFFSLFSLFFISFFRPIQISFCYLPFSLVALLLAHCFSADSHFFACSPSDSNRYTETHSTFFALSFALLLLSLPNQPQNVRSFLILGVSLKS